MYKGKHFKHDENRFLERLGNIAEAICASLITYGIELLIQYIVSK